MSLKKWSVLVLAFLVLGGFAVDASADDSQYPASLLLFPHFKTDGKNLSVITVTNVGDEDIVVRIVWVFKDKKDGHCVPADTWIELTRNDTFTFLDKDLFFEDEQGFSYMYVVDDLYSEAEVDYDYLIGQEMIWSADPEGAPFVVKFAINAVGFQALDVPAWPGPGGDGYLKLDGVEYETAPWKLLFPRFLGQPDLGGQPTGFKSWFIFVSLTGGKYYSQTTKWLVFNDNEKGFSRTVQFPCWKRIPLNEISGVFENSFLVGTDHDEKEPLGFETLVEAGWFYYYGEQAYYDTLTIANPSSYGVLVESIGAEFGSADLPWKMDHPDYNTGCLWPTIINP